MKTCTGVNSESSSLCTSGLTPSASCDFHLHVVFSFHPVFGLFIWASWHKPDGTLGSMYQSLNSCYWALDKNKSFQPQGLRH